MDLLPCPQRRRLPARVGVALLVAAVLVGCGTDEFEAGPSVDPQPEGATPAGTVTSSAPTPSPTPSPSPSPSPALDAESFDFANVRWIFRPYGETAETTRVKMSDGRAQQGAFTYLVGATVLAELTGDDLTDAAVEITQENDGIEDRQWYLWIADDAGGAEQVLLPIARTSKCGTAIDSVKAVPRGIEIHEFRRAIGEAESLPCSEIGTDERTRVVRAERAGGNDEWWPVQVAPRTGFGGLCPTAAEYEGFPSQDPLFVGPNRDSSRVEKGQTTVFSLVGWPVYGEDFAGWSLIGVRQGDDFLCAWAPRN